MIISASRRTDIPAFYTEWFMNRIREGFCTVTNPFNRNQISFVSLKQKDVDVVVFWTRNPAPLLSNLNELDSRGIRYYFQYTILDNPHEFDPMSPPVKIAINTFKKLSDLIGPDRVIWRYDPIILSNKTNYQFHIDRYQMIALQLTGFTTRSVISVVDFYKKASKRMANLKKNRN